MNLRVKTHQIKLRYQYEVMRSSLPEKLKLFIVEKIYKSEKKYIYINTLKYGFNAADDFRFDDHKTSDTLFILGSGASILSYSDKIWSIIGKHDSFGITNWLIHDFAPTYYSFEYSRLKANREIFNKNLFKAAEKLKHTVVFPKISKPNLLPYIDNTPVFQIDSYPKQLLKHSYVLPIMPGSRQNIIELEKELEELKKSGKYSPREFYDFSLSFTVSLDNIIHFAVIAGYKNIVLCGIDLNNTKYFYRENEKYYLNKGYQIPESQQLNTNIHNNINPMKRGITVDKLFNSIDNIILKPFAIKLYVALKSSALHPRFNSYFELM